MEKPTEREQIFLNEIFGEASSKDAEETAGMIAVVQTAGYPLAAVMPALMGGLFDLTQSWLPALLILAAAGLAYALAGIRAGKGGKEQS